MAIKRVKVTVETVTPLFLGGVNPRGEPEIRPSSIKGVLRFWWRALYGGVNPSCSAGELAKAESAVFGSTDQAAPFIIRVSPHTLPDKDEWRFGDHPGIDYLFFAFRSTRRDPGRIGFEPGQTFTITLQTRPGADADDAFHQACAALWLWTRFGALGARARRGAGCLTVVHVGEGWPEDLPSPKIAAKSPPAFLKENQSGLATLYNSLGWPTPQFVDISPAPFDMLHPATGHIYVSGGKFPTWEIALNAIGSAYQSYRSRYQPDYDNVKQVVSGRKDRLAPVERAAFGLPIVFYYRSLGGQRGTLEGAKSDRRTSPLAFHVSKLANGIHALQILHFDAALLPGNSGLKLKRRGRPAHADAPDNEIVTRFIQLVGTKPKPKRPNDLFIAPQRKIAYPRSD